MGLLQLVNIDFYDTVLVVNKKENWIFNGLLIEYKSDSAGNHYNGSFQEYVVIVLYRKTEFIKIMSHKGDIKVFTTRAVLTEKQIPAFEYENVEL